MTNDPLDQAKALLDEGATAEALAITSRLVAQPEPGHRALAFHSTALKGLGRREEALTFDRQATQRFTDNGVAWHNLAATLADLGRGPEAVAAMEEAFARRIDSPLSWAVMARAKIAAGDLEGSEQAYREALKRAPGQADFAAELADLLWMRSGDLEEAQAVLDRAAYAGAPPAPLLIAKAKLFDAAGRSGQGAELLLTAAQRMGANPAILLAAAQAALEQERLEEAERLALEAERLLPDSPGVLNQLAIVYLARGEPALALEKIRRALAFAPERQSLWGWAATAARATGDPLYRELYDYEAMVAAYDLETPPGWASIDAFLADLAAALQRLHLFGQHPSNQSLREGSQTTYRLTGSDDPAIRAFFQALDRPIREYMARLGQGSDPLRRRNTGDYRIEGAWSVRLRPGGFHKDHFHSEGWLSSAFYVETPEAALESAEKQGWIRFGQPPFKTVPALPAERYIRPKPGRLVLFPSYMWHGTVPFTTDESRMTIAFDVVPK